MKLSEILGAYPHRNLTSVDDIEITAITNDSRKADSGSLYFAIPGARVNGASFIPQTLAAGVSAIVTECSMDELNEFLAGTSLTSLNIPVVQVDSARNAMGLMSSRFYGEPSKKLTMIGITGTKGKTTTSYMVREMLESAGIPTGLVGTIEICDGKNVIPAANTTPESIILQEELKDMVANGLRACVMEVSSQALKLDRIAGVDFDFGIFTNLSPDHIGPDEHDSYEEYRDCKKRLFNLAKKGIFNVDDEESSYMMENVSCQKLTYGKKEGADFRAAGHELYTQDGILGIRFDLTGKTEGKIEVDLPGEFSIHNSLAAIAVATEMGVPFEKVQEILRTIKVRGRVEMVSISSLFTFMIDYAHNGMSLKSLLLAIKEYNPKRIVTIFGCGGNRAKSRRYEMGEISGKYADLSIITSDNPRFEEPQDILNDIKTGLARTDGKYVEIIDRKEAVRYAIMHAEPGDIIILAGKGHEDYQEIRGVKYHMDERELVKEVLEEEDVTKICGYRN